jgi:hypothetical protein
VTSISGGVINTTFTYDAKVSAPMQGSAVGAARFF